MNDIKKHMHEAFGAVLHSIKVDIDNCPDILWEKKYGGDFYWQQVFHVLAGTAGMLDKNMTMPQFPIPNALAMLKQYPGQPFIADYDGLHGKDIMYASLDILTKHVDTYFERLNPDDLFQLTDFFGKEMTLFDKIGIIISHVMYHVGALDAALRDHGAEASM